MNLNIKKHPIDSHNKTASNSAVGANALWSGPFNTDSLPKGQGSSSGKNGVIFNNNKPTCNYEPITQRAKSKF